MSEWQPIETAPRDGTDVLVGWETSDFMVTALWSQGAWADSNHEVPLADRPTHWQPLPEPPWLS